MRASGPEARLIHLVLLIMVLLAVSGSGCGGTGPGPDSSSRPIDASTADLGQSWTVLDAQAAGLSDPYAVHLAAVIDGPPGYVAVGGVSAPDGAGTVAAVWTSPDGRSWQRVVHDDEVFGSAEQPVARVSDPGSAASGAAGSGFAVMTDVAVAGGQLVAVGASENAAGHLQPAAWTSSDGRTWIRSSELGGPQSGDLHLLGVAGHDAGLVAVGMWRHELHDDSAVAVAASSDGQRWRLVPVEESIQGFRASPWQQMSAVVAGGPGLVAVGCADRPDQDAPDQAAPVQDAPDHQAPDAHAPHPGWVAAVWTSTDEASWTRVPHDEAVFGGLGSPWMRGVTVGGPGLVAVGSASASFEEPGPRTVPAVWTSTDGLAWTRGSVSEFAEDGEVELLDVVQTRAGLIAVGSVDIGGPDRQILQAAAWHSDDGEHWTRVGPTTPGQSSPGPDPAGPDPAGPDPDHPDDVEWAALTSVTDGPHGLVAVGFAGTSSDTARAVVWTSP